MKKVLIVIPAKNEEASISRVIHDIRSRFPHDILVIDDDSSDATAARARAAGAVVLTPVFSLGAWGAAQTGLRYALRQGYSLAVTLDADGQHPAEHIQELLDPLLEDEADVVIGSCVSRGSPLRQFAWRYFRFLTGLTVQDLTSGYRAYGRAAMEILTSDQALMLDFQDLGVLTLLRDSGLRVAETPVCMLPRQDGHSRIFHTWSAVAHYMLLSSVLCLAHSAPTRLAHGVVALRRSES